MRDMGALFSGVAGLPIFKHENVVIGSVSGYYFWFNSLTKL